MTKIWKNTIISIIVLASVSFVSVVMVLLIESLLPAKTNFFDKQKLNNICPATSYRQFTDDDLLVFGVSLDEFNANFTTASVRAVFRAEGGTNDGNFILEAEGLGYSDAYAVILYIAYNASGEIIGVTDLFVDKGNTFWSTQVKPYLNSIYEKLEGKSGDVGGGMDLQSGTGATQSLNGIARAVNIANTFVLTLLDSDIKEPYEVTDATVLTELRKLTNDTGTFTCYPYTSIEAMEIADKTITTEIVAVFVSGEGDIIFQTKSDAGTYGRPTLLVLVDKEEKSVLKINPLDLFVKDFANKDIVSEFLFDMDVLTEMFEGFTIIDIDSMGKYLTGATGATQSANGIKSAVKIALKNIDAFSEYFSQQNGGGENV